MERGEGRGPAHGGHEARTEHRLLLLPRAIRSAREKRSWTQAELADRLGVSQASVSFWERGIETPSLRHQIQLVTVLPEVFQQLAELEGDMLGRLYRLERTLNDGKCRCHGCGCGQEGG
ncbi:MAG TPA: helix-turn-helix transcriptional regulator [Anaerolineae bacterium]|nr:helix-turn-helix transcriptional regulator [Anaerolineae bacterium]